MVNPFRTFWKAHTMAVFLVTYDLNEEGAERPDITGFLRDHFDFWAELSESSYAIAADIPANTIFKIFEPLLDENDQLYVIPLEWPYAGRGPQQVNDWLESFLTP